MRTVATMTGANQETSTKVDVSKEMTEKGSKEATAMSTTENVNNQRER